MDLNSYLKKNDFSIKQASLDLKVDYETLRKWLTGERRPKWKNLKAIKKWSNGYVSADDFIFGRDDDND